MVDGVKKMGWDGMDGLGWGATDHVPSSSQLLTMASAPGVWVGVGNPVDILKKGVMFAARSTILGKGVTARSIKVGTGVTSRSITGDGAGAAKAPLEARNADAAMMLKKACILSL